MTRRACLCSGVHRGLRCDGGVLGRKIYLLGDPPFMLGVTPLFATPNHPSYPAAHGSFSGSISAVLAYLFPHDAAALNALGNEAGESRLWACAA